MQAPHPEEVILEDALIDTQASSGVRDAIRRIEGANLARQVVNAMSEGGILSGRRVFYDIVTRNSVDAPFPESAREAVLQLKQVSVLSPKGNFTGIRPSDLELAKATLDHRAGYAPVENPIIKQINLRRPN
jgi:hypothetical protein